jgi:hypothetical protein
VVGSVTVVKRKSLAVDQLWEMSHQGRLAKVSRQQFDAYYSNQKSGIGVSVGAAELWLSSDRTLPTSSELGATLATPTATSTINRRSDGSTEHRILNIAH